MHCVGLPCSCPHVNASAFSRFPLQFIDLCILLGCDYCGTIKGIGPKRAIDLIKQHGSIEEILENIDLSVSSRLLGLQLSKFGQKCPSSDTRNVQFSH